MSEANGVVNRLALAQFIELHVSVTDMPWFRWRDAVRIADALIAAGVVKEGPR